MTTKSSKIYSEDALPINANILKGTVISHVQKLELPVASRDCFIELRENKNEYNHVMGNFNNDQRNTGKLKYLTLS